MLSEILKIKSENCLEVNPYSRKLFKELLHRFLFWLKNCYFIPLYLKCYGLTSLYKAESTMGFFW